MKTPDQNNDLFACADAPPADAANKIGFPAEAVAAEAPVGGIGADSLGKRLAAARETRGMSIHECGQALRLPARVLQRLEAGDLGDTGQQVFARGALRTYARLLGLPVGVVEAALKVEAMPPQETVLVPTGNVPRGRWRLQRYGAAATYIVLTATVAVPLVWLGLRGGLDRHITQIAPLDNAPVAATAHNADVAAAKTASAAQNNEPPLLASMTPFSAMNLDTGNPAAPAPVPAPVAASVAPDHLIELRASAESWIEVVDTNGRKIDSGIMRAGEQRSYHSTVPLDITLGNADAVQVSRDGTPMSLKPWQHANVARFRVFGSASGASDNQ
ncbi:MAG: RodZ domain-containing protein [Rhodanobacteraceae bacterium]